MWQAHRKSQAWEFAEDFRRASLANKPAYSVIYDSTQTKRATQNVSIIEGKRGVLLAAWSNKGTTGDNDASNNIMLSVSADNGKTWSAPRVVVTDSAINPTFLRAPDGEVLLFYNAIIAARRTTKNSDVQDDNNIVYRTTADNSATWSDAKRLNFGYRVGIIVHNGIVLKNGDWLITFHYDRASRDKPFELSKTDYAAGVMISSDNGATWKLYGEIEVPNLSAYPNIKSWPVEPAVVETGAGHLLMFIRTRAGYIYRAASYDNGRNWTDAAPMLFSNPEHKSAAITLRDGHQLLLWTNCQVIDHGKKRFPLMASLSEDDGKTFPFTITLNDDPVPLVYPATVETGDGIKIVHGHNLEQVRLLTLRESDLRYKWTIINKHDAWRVQDGVLQMTNDADVETPYEWTKWAKAVAFLPNKPTRFTLDADVRFDAEIPQNGAIGVFSSYQDEDNWLAWAWSPYTGDVGVERQNHFGLTFNPTQYRQSKKTWFESYKPQVGKWYHVRIAQAEDNVHWELTERGNNKILSQATAYTRYDGHFLALGTRNVKASFDNIRLRGL